MSHPPEVCIPPFEFPLPRAVRYELLNSPTLPDTYSISIIASTTRDGITEQQEIDCANYSYSHLVYEIQDRYAEYSAQGGFVFPMDSIALRLKSMKRVLCWFGFRNDIKYSCYISKVVCTNDAPPKS